MGILLNLQLPHPPLPSSTLQAAKLSGWSAWKLLRKPSSGKDCWVSLSPSFALSELGCRSTGGIGPA